jgi:hypothetical protein
MTLNRRSNKRFHASNRNTVARSKAVKQNREELSHIDYRVTKYFTPIVPIIRAQLNKVARIIYTFEYTNEHPKDWVHRDLPALKKVQQTLMDALHFSIYTKEQYASLYKSPKKSITFTHDETSKVNTFFEPIIKEIHQKLIDISKVINEKVYRTNGKVLRGILLENEKELIQQLQLAKQHFHDLLHMIPHQNEMLVI